MEVSADYIPWPENGCTLEEARGRTADREIWREWRNALDKIRVAGVRSKGPTHEPDELNSLALLANEIENRINDDFQRQNTTGQLIAYGRPGQPGAASQRVELSCWQGLTDIDWGNSVAREDRPNGLVFFDVRVFPVLLAPCRIELLAGHSLAEVFKEFILGDPEVTALGKQAIKLAPEFERVFVLGHCYVRGVAEWPTVFDVRRLIGAVHPDLEKRGALGLGAEPDPIEAVIAGQALANRYGTLILMLRRSDLVARGLPVSHGPPEILLHSIWSHRSFRLDAQRGDILCINEACEDPPRDLLLRRWIGIQLEKPAATFHVQPLQNDQVRSVTAEGRSAPASRTLPTRHRRPIADAVATALRNHGLDKDPGKLTLKQVAALIRSEMPRPATSEHELEALRKAIERHYGERR